MSEKLCLKWNDFQENLNLAFGRLREDNDFTDVTLACVDGKQLEAHKVILATSSPFFQNLLGKNKHAYPIVYLKGMKSRDMVAILDFLYYGEANVYQDNLDAFLAIAEEFQLKGLTGKRYEEELNEDNQKQVPIKKQYQPKQTGSNGGLPHKEIVNDSLKPLKETATDSLKPPKQTATDTLQQSDNVLAIQNNLSGDFEELDEKVNSMLEKIGHLVPIRHKCKVCGKEGYRSDIKKHIEANHLEGVSIPCNFCEKTFRSRRSVYEHELKYHKKK